MDLDPRIFFIIVVPDGAPTQATPTQGFAISLIQMSWAIRAISLLPTDILDLTDRGRDVLLARRVTGTSPVNWYGQSPRAIRSSPHPPFVPFTVIILPPSEKPEDYEEWAKSSPVRPTIVAKSGGDLSELSLEGLQAQFLKVCDHIPDIIRKESIVAAKNAIAAWKPMSARKLDYQVGGHNTIAPNITALTVAGYEGIETGRMEQVGATVKPYVDQIVKTSNSIFDERARLGERDLQRIFKRPPDLNLFAPSMFPHVFDAPIPLDMDKELRKETLVVRQALQRQTGYGFILTTEAQRKAMIGEIIRGEDGEISSRRNPLIAARASELFLNTELMCALSASEFSVCARHPMRLTGLSVM